MSKRVDEATDKLCTTIGCKGQRNGTHEAVCMNVVSRIVAATGWDQDPERTYQIGKND